nr:BEN domain [Hymenolepis microstoma]
MEAGTAESFLDSDLLQTFPRDSLVTLVHQLSTEVRQLRSQVEILERRNAMLQDLLPEIIQTTIRSTLNPQSESIIVNNCQSSDKIENGKSPNCSNTIPVSIDIGGGGPVIPPAILSMANNFTSPSVPSSSLAFESNDLTGLLNSFLSKSLNTDSPNLPNLPPLSPPKALKEDENKFGIDDDGFGERDEASSSFIIPMVPSPPRSTGTRSEVSSLLSSEVMTQIEDQIMSSSFMNERRKQYWQIYLNSKEWTRATCALMSCLFTRTQMANSTVLGRSSQVGGGIRNRLPSTFVHYIVTKINQRFGVNPVKIRARMAQKCKDLRR